MKPAGKPQAFFWELAVVILFFALAAAVTLQLFAAGSVKSRGNTDRGGAMLAAVSAAERIAAAETSQVLMPGGGVLEAGGSVEVGFDSHWEAVTEDPVFRMTVSAVGENYPEGLLCRYEIRVEKVTSEELYTLETAKYFAAEGEMS